MRDQLFYYFKSKLNPSQHGVFQSKSTTTNLVSYLDYISPLICSQCQVDAIYFDLSSTFDPVSHTVLLHKLRAYGLSDGYVSWLHSYTTNRYSVFEFMAFIPHPLKCFLVFLKDLFLGPFSLMYLLIILAILLNTLDIFYLLIILKFIAS
jgi:hypothetical protein